MFEQSLVESTGALRTGNRKPAVISVSVQLLLVAALLIWPLMHPEVVLPRTLPMTLFAPPKAPLPPPPPQRIHTEVVNTSTAPMMFTTAPYPISHPEPASTRGSDAPPALSPISIGGSGDPTAAFAPTSSSGSGSSIAVMPATPARPASRTTISSGVAAGLLIEPIRPLYPAFARAAGIGGTVVVSAVISKSGRIESAHATSGPEMLRNAAVDSVRVARYHPFLLNGQPTEVEASFSIHFQLNQ